jgi:Short C-terminal domain
MLLSLVIALPGILTRWVFLKRPIKKLTALVIVAPTWILLLWMYHQGGGEGSPIFITLGSIFMYIAFVAPFSQKTRSAEPATSPQVCEGAIPMQRASQTQTSVAPSPGAPPPIPSSREAGVHVAPHNLDIQRRLEQLKSLHDQQLISPEDYDAKKKEILQDL